MKEQPHTLNVCVYATKIDPQRDNNHTMCVCVCTSNRDIRVEIEQPQIQNPHKHKKEKPKEPQSRENHKGNKVARPIIWPRAPLCVCKFVLKKLKRVPKTPKRCVCKENSPRHTYLCVNLCVPEHPKKAKMCPQNPLREVCVRI